MRDTIINNSKVNSVYRIFQDFFGEDRVDIQYTPVFENFLHIVDVNRDLTLEVFSTHLSKGHLLFPKYDNIKNVKLSHAITENSGLIYDLFIEALSTDTIPEIANIMIHFPEVKVENEEGASTIIKHLWAKVGLNYDGTSVGFFGLNRSHYTYAHYKNNYLHSHIRNIPKSNFSFFDAPCLGSGPIKDTIHSLTMDYNESFWQLFCLELDRYVRTESLRGIPYHKLVDANQASYLKRLYVIDFGLVPFNLTHYSSIVFPEFPSFIRRLLSEKIIKFTINNGTIVLGMSWEDYLLSISNLFIKWINEKSSDVTFRMSWSVLSDEPFIHAIKENGRFVQVDVVSNTEIINVLSNIKICTFKGEDVLLEVEQAYVEDDTVLRLLNPIVAGKILIGILTYINYEKSIEDRHDSKGFRRRKSIEEILSTGQKTIFL